MRMLRISEQALAAVSANKTRTILMMLGVVIGVATMTIIASSVIGTRAEVLARVEKFGLHRVGIIAGAGRKPGVPQPVSTTLRVEDAQALLSEIANVQEVCPEIIRTDCPVKSGNKSTYTGIVATNPRWPSVWDLGVVSGRFFSEEEDLHLARVAVIGPTIRRDLFEDRDPVGMQIIIGKNPFEVIGVLEPRGTAPSGDDMDNQIVIPISTGQRRVFHQDYLFAMKVGLRNSAHMSQTVNDIRELLRERHKLPDGVEDDFTIISPTLIMNMMANLSSTFGLFLVLVSGISLVVGAIVIANIMLIAVNERGREIGIRRAVGARKSDILAQFLLESVSIAASGGIIGIVLGLLGLNLLSGVMKLPTTFVWQPCLLAFLSSIAVGLAAGIHPAKRAANRHPIDALK